MYYAKLTLNLFVEYWNLIEMASTRLIGRAIAGARIAVFSTNHAYRVLVSVDKNVCKQYSVGRCLIAGTNGRSVTSSKRLLVYLSVTTDILF